MLKLTELFIMRSLSVIFLQTFIKRFERLDLECFIFVEKLHEKKGNKIFHVDVIFILLGN